MGLVLSLWLAQHQAASMAQIEEARFTQETRAFSDALSQRIASHTEVVNGLRGLFTANPRLSPDPARIHAAALSEHLRRHARWNLIISALEDLTTQARDGEIVVARLDDDVTVKRLQRKAGHIELIAENPDFEPIIVRPGEVEFAIEGVAVGLIRGAGSKLS